MLRCVRLACMVLAGVLLAPSASFCTSYYLLPPFANVVWTGKAVVVAYDAGADVRVQGHDATNGSVCWSRRIPAATLARDICEEQGLVYVATSNQGIYVLNSDTGSVKARLRPHSPVAGEPLLACAKNRVLVAYAYDKWLIAYSTQNLRPVWKHVFRSSSIYEMAARGDKFTVLVLNLSSREHWKQVVFLSDNGRFLARRPATAPAYAVPEYLPKAVREWFSKKVGVNSGAGRTTYERRGKLWFVGVPAELCSSGNIYAVRDDGHVVWTKSVKGLSSMVSAHDRLIAAAVHYDDRQGDVWPGSVELFALDVTTGRQLWLVDLRP